MLVNQLLAQGDALQVSNTIQTSLTDLCNRTSSGYARAAAMWTCTRCWACMPAPIFVFQYNALQSDTCSSGGSQNWGRLEDTETVPVSEGVQGLSGLQLCGPQQNAGPACLLQSVSQHNAPESAFGSLRCSQVSWKTWESWKRSERTQGLSGRQLWGP